MRVLAERRSQILGLAERYRAGEVRRFRSVARGDNTGDSRGFANQTATRLFVIRSRQFTTVGEWQFAPIALRYFKALCCQN